MNYCQLAQGGHAFTSSTCLAQGNFQNPQTVLDTVFKAKQIKDGVLVISDKTMKGRIGIVNNSLVIGGVIDSTGESGVSAVYKLLLLPRGTFLFRQAVPQDYWELKQEINQGFEELKTFLAGPSSIGLSSPIEVGPVSADQRISQQILESPFMTSNPNNVQSMIDVIGVESAIAEIAPRSQAVSSPGMRHSTDEYTKDCGQLLQAVAEKHDLRKELDMIARKKEATKNESLKPLETPPPKQDRNSLRMVVLFLLAGLTVVLVASTGGVSEDSALANTKSTVQTATERSAIALVAAASGESSSTPPPVSKTARFILPSQSAINQVAPSGTTSAKRDHYFLASHTIDSKEAKVNQFQVTNKKETDSKSISFWAQAVRKDPNDAGAREHLAYALLMEGDRKISVQQFEALMTLRRLTADEIVRYVDALLEHDESNLAKQVIVDALAFTPNDKNLLAKLASIN